MKQLRLNGWLPRSNCFILCWIYNPFFIALIALLELSCQIKYHEFIKLSQRYQTFACGPYQINREKQNYFMNIQLVQSQAHLSNSKHRPASMDTKSRYVRSSYKPDKNPQVLHTFFNDKPLVRFSQDISRMRPVSYESPQPVRLLNRPFIIVDVKEKYGQPLTQAQIDAILKKKTVVHEIVTYGVGVNEDQPKDKKSSAVPPPPFRQKVDIKVESGKHVVCCCCGDDPKNKKVYVDKLK